MLLKSPWKPRIAKGSDPLYRRLATALTEDLLSGRLPPGARLPAHRDLSYRLSVSLGTVTKAYALLERKGLVHSEHGRGMFATACVPVRQDTINLSVNLPPNVISDRLLSNSLRMLSHGIDSATFGADTPAQGKDEHRLLIANWLQPFCPSVTMENLIFCNTAQGAISQVLSHFDPASHCLATDNLPYPPIRNMADRLGIEIHGLNTDEEGILPTSLDETAHAVSGNGKHLLLFTNHSHQNPTGKSMSAIRVNELAHICKKQNVWVIEDDVYAIYSAPGRTCFLDVLAEQTFHVTGVSKILTPGLRLGFLTAPPRLVDDLVRQIGISGSNASPIACLLLAQWIEDGMASDIVAMVREEVRERSLIAQDALGNTFPDSRTCGLHSFLPMCSRHARALAATAATHNIIVTPPAEPINGDISESGIRLCLGSTSRQQLRTALYILAEFPVPAGMPDRQQQSWGRSP